MGCDEGSAATSYSGSKRFASHASKLATLVRVRVRVRVRVKG